MKVVVLASQKGGSGKSTLTANLAVAAELAGDGPVVVIDTDPQASLASWWNSRDGETPALAPSSLAELPIKLQALDAAGFQLAFVDTPPAITDAIRAVIRHADLVAIPVKPSPHDLRAVGSTVEIALGEDRAFAFIVTMAKPNANLTAQAVAALSAHGVVSPAIIGDRVDFAASMVDGRTVQETDPKGRSAGEVADLWEFIKARFNDKKKARKVASQ